MGWRKRAVIFMAAVVLAGSPEYGIAKEKDEKAAEGQQYADCSLYRDKRWSLDKAGNSGVNPFSFQITRMEAGEIEGNLRLPCYTYYTFKGTVQNGAAVCTLFEDREKIGELQLAFCDERTITAVITEFRPAQDGCSVGEIGKEYVFTPYHLRDEAHDAGFSETLRLETDMDFWKKVTVRVGVVRWGQPCIVLTDEWGDVLWSFEMPYGKEPLRAWVGDADGDGRKDIMVDVEFSEVDYPGRAAEKYIFCGKEGGGFTTKPLVQPVGGSEEWEELLPVEGGQDWESVKGAAVRTQPEPAYDSWQSAYISYLKQTAYGEDMLDGRKYRLIYVDDDEIPELACLGYIQAEGCQIVNYSEGEYHVTRLMRCGFSYLERGNLLCNSEGNTDHYYDIVYSIIDGRMSIVAQGFWGSLYRSPNVVEDGILLYLYNWNGRQMSEEEYSRALGDAFDGTKACNGYDGQTYTSDKMIALLEKEKLQP